MMKKHIATIFAAAAIACFMSIPAFAAETRSEYREEAAAIRQEIVSVNEQLGQLREANSIVSDKCKEISAARKETGELPIDKGLWNQVKELRAEIAQYRVSKEDAPDNQALRAAAKASADEGNYDEALSTLDQLLETKKERLEKLEQANSIWQQIDTLLQ